MPLGTKSAAQQVADAITANFGAPQGDHSLNIYIPATKAYEPFVIRLSDKLATWFTFAQSADVIINYPVRQGKDKGFHHETYTCLTAWFNVSEVKFLHTLRADLDSLVSWFGLDGILIVIDDITYTISRSGNQP